MAKNNIIACTNPYWHYYSPIYYNELEKPFLGEARAKAEYPMKTLLDAGVKISRASGFPCYIPSPFNGRLTAYGEQNRAGSYRVSPSWGKRVYFC